MFLSLGLERLLVQFQLQRSSPGCHAHEKSELRRLGEVNDDLRAPFAGKPAGLFDGHVLTPERELDPRTLIRADGQGIHAIQLGLQVRRLHRQYHAARAAGMTAGDSRVEWFLSFESRVVAPLVPARVLGGSQMVIERALELVAELRFAREPEKLKVELNPGGRDARLANVRTHLVGQDMIVPEKFARAGAAGDVQTVRDDVVPGVPHRL